jgi:ACR3 family arsenite transporter
MNSEQETTTAKEAEVENCTNPLASCDAHVSAFKGLGWLDRLLALWILLAMVIGVLLGNFVPNVGPALMRGTFVGVSIPIGECPTRLPFSL